MAAVSVGIVDGRAIVDLDYAEDFSAEVDMNVAMTKAGKYVEIQGTAEAAAFDGRQLQALLRLARSGVRKFIAAQEQAVRRMK